MATTEDIVDLYLQRQLDLIRAREGEALRIGQLVEELNEEAFQAFANANNLQNIDNQVKLFNFWESIYEQQWNTRITESLVRAGAVMVRDEIAFNIGAMEIVADVAVLNVPDAQRVITAATVDPFQGKPIAQWSADIPNHLVNDLKAQVAPELQRAFIQGESIPQAVKRIQDNVESTLIRSKRDAEAIARSNIMHHANKAREATFAANNELMDGLIWVSTLDHRTCWVKNTQVLTDTGYKNISDITTADKVLNRSGDLQQVIDTSTSITDRTIELIFVDDNNNEFILECTPDHLFLLTNGQWVEAQDLHNDLEIATIEFALMKKHLIKKTIKQLTTPITVYDIQTKDEHFIVHDMVVHNSDTCRIRDRVEYNMTPNGIQPVNPNDPPWGAGPSSIHWGCLPEYQKVAIPSKINKAYFRAYSGDVIHIMTELGRVLTATPNHPILTPTGWRPMEELAVSDQVVVSDDPLPYRPIGEITNSLLLRPDHLAIYHQIDHTSFHGDVSEYPQAVMVMDKININRQFLKSHTNRQTLKTTKKGLSVPYHYTYKNDTIISVRREPYDGYVYNLETTDGHYYADGIVTHNCRSTSSPLFKGIQRTGRRDAIEPDENYGKDDFHRGITTRGTVRKPRADARRKGIFQRRAGDGDLQDKATNSRIKQGIPTQTNYEKWLRQQVNKGPHGRAFVEDILGKQRAALFEKGVPFNQLTANPKTMPSADFNQSPELYGKPLTLQQLEDRAINNPNSLLGKAMRSLKAGN